ncbi:neprilysin-1-like [Glandiceps talaboti]
MAQKDFMGLVCGLLLVCCCCSVYSKAIVKRGYDDNTSNHVSEEVDGDDAVNYCMTDHCKRLSEEIAVKMDFSVDPCEDFFEFSCGKWNRDHDIPGDKSRYDMFMELKRIVTDRVIEMLSTPNNETESDAIIKAKNNFKACMDTDAIEVRGSQPLIDVITHLGGWPVLGDKPGGNWNEELFNLEDLMSTLLREIGSSFLVLTYVSTDSKESSRHVIKFDQASPSLPSREYYLDGAQDIAGNKFLKAYYEFMLKVSLMLGANKTEAEKQLKEVVEFEIAMVNLTSPSENRRDMEKLYNKMTFTELQVDVPQINWMNYINKAGVASIEMNEAVVVHEPVYMKEVIQMASQAEPRTVTNYLIWRAITNVITQLSSQYRNATTAYSSVVYGTRSELPRNDTCMNHVNYIMRFATGRMFIDEYYNTKSKESTNEMITYIQQAFKSMIDESLWMDVETRKVAKEKIHGMLRKIGYPDWLQNDQDLNEYYKNFDFTPENNFGNYMQYAKWRIHKNFDYLRKPVDPNEWGVGPAIVNAFYDFTNNDITFPAGILQGLYYHKDSPKYLNFGGIGIVIGHEMTHGFDDRGRQYDKNGNLQQWWSEDSINKYKERAQCIIDQYDQYWLPECNMTLNGVLTQGENIADNGGLKEAYKAYKLWVEDTGQDDPLLPGLDFSQEQLFFINFGQIWCSKYTEQGARNKVLSGAHSPGRYRCIGPLSNSPEFSMAFNCPVNSTMNPINKCTVW